MKKIAMVLSGCGNQDGAEITETVCLLVALYQNGADVSFFAPDVDFDAKDFRTQQKMGEKRNVLREAARIARGKIEDIKNLKADNFDAVAFPGGFGAATNLSTWGSKGAQCEVLPEVTRVIKEFHSQSKPIAAVCIAPTLVAKVLGKEKVELTIGDDKETAAEITKTGAQHIVCPVDDYVTDRMCKVITTPAYMYGNAKPHQIAQGISGLAKELVEMS
jgi:enhancing lycopene biosynthesis protein 2